MGPLTLKLMRHGQSQANVLAVNPQKAGDYRVPLTEQGKEDARIAGERIGAAFLRDALVYTSPYVRAKETLAGVLRGAQAEGIVKCVYEDPRLREVDHGYSDVRGQEPLRATHGWFYYRYEGGESPADCFDRVSGFLESLMRQVERQKAERVLVVTHGLSLRCFVMRFLRLTVDEFEGLENPHPGDVVTLAGQGSLDAPCLQRGRWDVTGLRFLQRDLA